MESTPLTQPKKYPAWRYHSEHAPRIIETEAEIEAAAAEGWVDSPGKAVTTEAAPAGDIPPRLTDELIEQSRREGPFDAPTPEGSKPKRKRLGVSGLAR